MTNNKTINALRLKSALSKFADQIKAEPEAAKKLLHDNGYTASEANQIIEKANEAPADETKKAEVKKAPAEAKAKGDFMVKYNPEKDQYHYCTIAEHKHVEDTPGIELEKGWDTIAENKTITEALAEIDGHKAEVLKEKEKAAKKAAKLAEAEK